jgi:mannose-6-phosphate isomerase-like protein (cupin superfamily)
MKYHVTLAEAISKLNHDSEHPFAVLLKHGTLQVEYFVPRGIDTQSAHEQDELYIIASGHSDFYRNGEVIKCQKGDVLFVPAGMEHRFQHFSNDFATYVIFYGKKGGEAEG